MNSPLISMDTTGYDSFIRNTQPCSVSTRNRTRRYRCRTFTFFLGYIITAEPDLGISGTGLFYRIIAWRWLQLLPLHLLDIIKDGWNFNDRMVAEGIEW